MRNKSQEPVFYVYAHRTVNDDVIFYVGKGKDDRAFHKRGRNKFWRNITNKHQYEVCFLHTNLTESEALDLEKIEIQKIKMNGARLANMTDGGEGLSGYVFSEESKKKCSDNNSMKIPENRKKVSDALKLALSTHEAKAKRSQIAKLVQSRPDVLEKKKNRKHSEETKRKMSASSAMKRPEVIAKFLGENNPAKRPEVRKKISEAKKGFKHTDEARQKMSNFHSGKILSDEHKMKIKIASTGKKHSEESKAKMSEMCKMKPKLRCPNCGKLAQPHVAKRWHFDNCKDKI